MAGEKALSIGAGGPEKQVEKLEKDVHGVHGFHLGLQVI